MITGNELGFVVYAMPLRCHAYVASFYVHWEHIFCHFEFMYTPSIRGNFANFPEATFELALPPQEGKYTTNISSRTREILNCCSIEPPARLRIVTTKLAISEEFSTDKCQQFTAAGNTFLVLECCSYFRTTGRSMMQFVAGFVNLSERK